MSISNVDLNSSGCACTTVCQTLGGSLQMVEILGIDSASLVYPLFFSVEIGEYDVVLHKKIKKSLQSTA